MHARGLYDERTGRYTDKFYSWADSPENGARGSLDREEDGLKLMPPEGLLLVPVVSTFSTRRVHI
ncbi:hypothetical protein T484DRAFT_2109198 [Baffinella frigidus]|nr:hypothetical protein T484DRAFT_2109198 [Cryptophyta sp. CCMP2293]